MTTYRNALTAAMTELGARPDALFLGQAVAYPGTGMTATLAGVPRDRLIELPVAEDLQMGMGTGLALAGFLPVLIYPRINFLLLAINQLVLHLDKLPIYSDGGYRPRVIIRTMIASPEPMDPGPQHLGNFTQALRQMLTTVEVIELLGAIDVAPAYRHAAERAKGATLIVEHVALYDRER